MNNSFNIYFSDRRMNITGMASTKMPHTLQILEDKEIEDIGTGVAVFETTIGFSTTDDIDNIVDVGSYVLFQSEEGEGKFFTVIRTEKNADSKELYIYAEDAGLDLLNEIMMPYSADKAYPISHYIEKFTFDSGFKIAINELGESLSRKLEWTGEDTATKRLLSVCTQFDSADISYSFSIQGLTVVSKNINLYKKRGNDIGTTLRLKQDVNNIITSRSIENLATALIPEGATPEGQDNPITLQGYTYDDGRFYVNGRYLLDRKSVAIWSRYLSPDETGTDTGHIVRPFSFETDSQRELCNRAVSHLSKISEVEQNFDVDMAILPDNCRIGDRVNIVDTVGKLYLKARVLKLENSRSHRVHTAVLGEYLIQSSGISQQLQLLADKIAAMQDGASSYLWVRYADDDQGNGFSSSPTNKSYIAVKAVINNPVPSDNPADYTGLWSKFVGKDGLQGQDGADGKPTFTWIRYADTVSGSGISVESEGKKYIGFAYNKNTSLPSNNPADYQWSLFKGEAGADGKTAQFHIAWADKADGTIGFSLTESIGKKYMGTYTDFIVVSSTDPAKYSWIELTGAYQETLNAIQTQVDGIAMPIISEEQPSNGLERQQWWKTDSEGNVIGYFVYTSGDWQPQTIQQSILNIVELNSVKITAADITGTKIAGSSFINVWDKTATTGRSGVLTIENGIINSKYVVKESQFSGEVTYEEAKILMEERDVSNTVVAAARVTPSAIGLQYQDPITLQMYTGSIKAQSLHNFGWKTVSLETGWVAAESNPPAYKKVVNLDGTWTIKWRGQVKRSSGQVAANQYLQFINNLPVEARPNVTEFTLAATSTAAGARLAVGPAGWMQVYSSANVDYVVLSGFSYDKEGV